MEEENITTGTIKSLRINEKTRRGTRETREEISRINEKTTRGTIKSLRIDEKKTRKGAIETSRIN